VAVAPVCSWRAVGNGGGGSSVEPSGRGSSETANPVLGGRPDPLNPRAAAGSEVDLVSQTTAGPEMPPIRRLAAILAADVAGYSRLIAIPIPSTGSLRARR
jgi:hypothetical protein